MIRIIENPTIIKSSNVAYVAESIEDKVRRIVENNEPITDGAPLIYTPREDGVHPETDIRTDKWEIALNAMNDAATKNRVKASEIVQTKKPETTKEPSGGNVEE